MPGVPAATSRTGRLQLRVDPIHHHGWKLYAGTYGVSRMVRCAVATLQQLMPTPTPDYYWPGTGLDVKTFSNGAGLVLPKRRRAKASRRERLRHAAVAKRRRSKRAGMRATRRKGARRS